MSNITIEEATAEDAKGIFEVQMASWLVTYPNEELGITEDAIAERFADTETKVKRWEEILKLSKSQMWVAKNQDQVVGFCGVKHEGDLDRLSSMYVHPDQVGTGIGGRLMRNALEYLGNEKDIVLDVANYNENAISFYKKYGFEETGNRKECINLNGVSLPETTMILKATK